MRDRIRSLLGEAPPPAGGAPGPAVPVERGTLGPSGGTVPRGMGYERPRPEPPAGASNYVLLVLDSCRFDAWVAAKPRVMGRLGELQHRYSYASWTSPSHYNLLMGLLPHPSPRHVYASDHYREDFLLLRDRLGLPQLSFLEMLPRLWLPHFLRNRAGYHTQALTSLPVLNPDTPLAADFDTFELMPRHNDLRAMLTRLRFDDDRPTFALLNAGETHYPYALPDEPEDQWPRINGVHGVFKSLDASLRAGAGGPLPPRVFDEARLRALQQRQVEAVRHIDGVVEELFDRLPPNTWVTITADHGELFGEDGYFGHGPIMHENCFEVPFVEGFAGKA